ncbi:hypothetical protein Aperf_G00000117206 [Anoplocephala perfoliata]
MALVSTLTLNNGRRIPQLAFGTFDAQKEDVVKAVGHAIDTGFRHIDSAMFFDNEQEVGQAIAAGLKRNNLKREDLFITSKLWCDKHAPEDVRKACQLSIKNLGVKYLDLYLMHWPMSFHLKEDAEFDFTDPDTLVYESYKLEDTWKAMEKLVSDGLVRSIGVSNFNKRQIEDIIAHGSIVPAVNQIEVNLHWLNTKLIDFCQSKGLQVEAYSPFGFPGFTQKRQAKPLLEQSSVVQIAKKHNKTAAQVLLRHAIQRNLVVITKSVNPERITSNFNVFDFVLTSAEMDKLNKAGMNRRNFDIPAFAQHPEYPFKDEF